jgi:glucose-6-phosphate 1-dehydrogenase
MAHTFVIFGASGDLTSRKLIPALFQLFRKKRLPADTRIIGFSRTPFTHDAWRAELAESTAKFAGKDFDQQLWTTFAAGIFYHAGDISQPADFDALAAFLDDLEKDPESTRI